MSIWSKVLLWLIGISLLVLFYSAARTLQTFKSWGAAVKALERDLEQAQKQQEQLLDGGPQGPGLRDVSRDLAIALTDRGHAWRDVAPGQIDPMTGAASVTVQSAAGITDSQVLYLFSSAPLPEGGRYLGEFRVTGIAENQIALSPADKLAPTEIERLQKSPGPWEMLDALPTDGSTVFAGVDDATRDALLPESVRAEYRKDGQPAEANDPPDRVQDGKYVRRLRDYQVSLHEFARLRTIMADKIAAAQKDRDYLQRSLENAQQTEAYREQEIAQVKAELAKVTAERDAAVDYLSQTQTQLAEVRGSIDRLARENKKLAGDFARWQRQAAQAAPTAETLRGR